jgi:hypothetical protein
VARCLDAEMFCLACEESVRSNHEPLDRQGCNFVENSLKLALVGTSRRDRNLQHAFALMRTLKLSGAWRLKRWIGSRDEHDTHGSPSAADSSRGSRDVKHGGRRPEFPLWPSARVLHLWNPSKGQLVEHGSAGGDKPPARSTR